MRPERVSIDPAQKNKRLRTQLEVMTRENTQLRAERDDAKEENRAAKLVIEYFRTHNPPKPSSAKCSPGPAGNCEQERVTSEERSNPFALDMVMAWATGLFMHC